MMRDFADDGKENNGVLAGCKKFRAKTAKAAKEELYLRRLRVLRATKIERRLLH